MMNERFAEAVLNELSETPKLLSDVIASLRYKGWKNLREQEAEKLVREFGGYVAWRKHGAGAAVYVATTPFSEVRDRFGKMVPVQA